MGLLAGVIVPYGSNWVSYLMDVNPAYYGSYVLLNSAFGDVSFSCSGDTCAFSTGQDVLRAYNASIGRPFGAQFHLFMLIAITGLTLVVSVVLVARKANQLRL